MAKRQLPPIHEIRQRLRCDPEAGKLFWLAPPKSHFARETYWQRFKVRYAGKEAFTAYDAYGYRIGSYSMRGERWGLKAHRVIWALEHDEWPDGDIDHINGVRDDNRLSNLRACSRAQNLANTTQVAGDVPYFGVQKQGGRFLATISENNTPRHIGSYATAEEAARARDAVALKLRGEFARLNFPA